MSGLDVSFKWFLFGTGKKVFFSGGSFGIPPKNVALFAFLA